MSSGVSRDSNGPEVLNISKKTELKGLFVILVCSLALRLLWYFFTQPVPESDFEDYRLLAENLVVHHQFGYPEETARRLPGYPFFLSVLMVFNDQTAWLSLWNVFLSSLLPVFVFLLGSRLLGNRKTALVASMLVMLNPSFLFLAPVIASEHLFVLLVAAVLLVVSGRETPGRTGLVLSGVLVGAAVLVRGEGLILMAVIPGFLWLEGCLLPAILRKTAVIGVTAAAIVVPWAFRNSMVLESPLGLSSTTGVNFYYGHNRVQYGYHELDYSTFEERDEANRSGEALRIGLDRLIRSPWTLATDVIQGTWELYRPTRYALYYSLQEYRPGPETVGGKRFTWNVLMIFSVAFYLFLLILSGLAAAKRLINLRALRVLGLVVAMNWLFYAVLFFAQPRFRYLTEMVLCLLAAPAISWLQGRWKGLGGGKVHP